MLHMILGGAGCGKSTMLRQLIREKTQSGCLVRTIVPDQFAFTYDQRLYDVLGAELFHRCRTTTFRFLTEEILEQAAKAPNDAAGDAAKIVLLHQMLKSLCKSHALRFYGRQAEKSGFLDALMEQLSSLMQANITPSQLLEAAGNTTGVLSDKLQDIARMYADHLADLESHGLRDVQKDMALAAQEAEKQHYFKDAVIVLDEFESFTGDQLALLHSMLRDAAEVWIALRTDDPNAPKYSRFDMVNRSCQRLREMAKGLGQDVAVRMLTKSYRFRHPSLTHLSRYIFAPKLQRFDGETAVTIVEARDITLEVEYTAAQIRQLLMQGDIQAKDITVVMQDLPQYGSLLENAFERYEIPYFMDLRRSVLHTAVMKLPLCLLELMRKSTTEQILLLLKTQLTPLSPEQIGTLENYAFTWSIDGEQWDKPFVSSTDPKGIAETQRLRLMDPILKMRRAVEQAQDGATICELLYRCIEEMECLQKAAGMAKGMQSLEEAQTGRAMRRLWDRMSDVLEALHAVLLDVPATPLQVKGMLEAVLRRNHIAVPPQTLDAVMVQPVSMARYDDPKVVFILGVQDGQFPAEAAVGGFFTELERHTLQQQGIEAFRLTSDLNAAAQLTAYKALSAASEKLWISYALADEAGSKQEPSPILQQIGVMLLPGVRRQRAADMPIEFYVSTTAAAYYSFVQDYHVSEADRATIRTLLESQSGEAARLERLYHQQNPERLRINDPKRMQKLLGTQFQMSASRLDEILKCPFRGFCRTVLNIKPREKQMLDNRSIGTLVHFCMERLFARCPDRSAFTAMTSDDIRQHVEQCAERYLEEQLGGKEGKTPRFLQNYSRVTERVCGLMAHTQEEMQQSQFWPDSCEMKIGKMEEQEDVQAYQLKINDTVTMQLRGSIDRVDLYEQGGKQYVRVVDYKTGKITFSLSDVYYGMSLQMLLYLFALLDDPQCYPKAEAAGVLYVPASSPEYKRQRDDAQSVEEFTHAYYRMNGMVLNDMEVLKAMEKDVAGVYIPAAVVKDSAGQPTAALDVEASSVFTPEQLRRLRSYVEQLLQDNLQSFVQGDVAPHPLCDKKDDFDACKYCAYESICGIESSQIGYCRNRMSEKEAEAAMHAILNSKESDPTQDEEKEDVQ